MMALTAPSKTSQTSSDNPTMFLCLTTCCIYEGNFKLTMIWMDRIRTNIAEAIPEGIMNEKTKGQRYVLEPGYIYIRKLKQRLIPNSASAIDRLQ